MRRGRIADDLDPVSELHTLDQFWQLVMAVDAAPTFLRAIDKLEDHGERSLVRQTAFRPDGAVPDGRKGGFVVRKCFQCSAGKS